MGTSTATMCLLRSRERTWLRRRVLLRCRLGVPLACVRCARVLVFTFCRFGGALGLGLPMMRPLLVVECR
eukprot:1795019-Prymnesium_polylepis.1